MGSAAKVLSLKRLTSIQRFRFMTHSIKTDHHHSHMTTPSHLTDTHTRIYVHYQYAHCHDLLSDRTS